MLALHASNCLLSFISDHVQYYITECSYPRVEIQEANLNRHRKALKTKSEQNIHSSHLLLATPLYIVYLILFQDLVTRRSNSCSVRMPFSHHSHSGEFCGHATNTLEDVVKTAISKGMTTFCMTEHIHRERIDFYPGEEQDHTPESLEELYDKFYQEAKRLQLQYASQIQLFVGFETEWIRPSSLDIIQNILGKYELDLFVGSVHHVYTIPIDFDTELYHKARATVDGSDERIAEQYFDDQLAMLEALKPPVVGHFDLIRLKSDNPEQSFRQWPHVWEKLMRNLKYIAEYGGILELNSSSLRKGMSEAYPRVEICKVSKMSAM